MYIFSQWLEAVRVWIGNNRLQIKPGKTEWLWILRPTGSRIMPSLVFYENTLAQTDPVCNLGILLNSQLLLDEQVAVVARRTFSQLHLRHQWSFLDQQAQLTLTHTLVTSRLEYSNALYMGLPLNSIWKLWLVWNAVSRPVRRAPRTAQVTPLFHELRWLPVYFWIQFKLLDWTWKVLHGMGLGCLRDCLFPVILD